jgi:hypothetical protein
MDAHDNRRSVEPACQDLQPAGRRHEEARAGVLVGEWRQIGEWRQLDPAALTTKVGLGRRLWFHRGARDRMADRIGPQQEATAQVLPFGLIGDAVDTLAADLGRDAVIAETDVTRSRGRSHRRGARHQQRRADDHDQQERGDPHRDRQETRPGAARSPLLGRAASAKAHGRVVVLGAVQLSREAACQPFLELVVGGGAATHVSLHRATPGVAPARS